MRIFDVTRTLELTECDLTKGYLQTAILEHNIPAQEPIPGQYRYITIREYPNKGKEVKKIIDVTAQPYIPAHTETEEIQIYIPYTEEELALLEAQAEIALLKTQLADTDYQAIKYAEGALSLQEYSPMMEQRRLWRKRINELEETIASYK